MGETTATADLPTADELRELATAPGDRGLAALQRGDLDAAREIALGAVDAHVPLRDIYTAWNVLTVEYIRREFGEDAAGAAVRENLRTVVRPILELFRNGVSREAVSTVTQILRMDAGRLDAVTEDETAITLTATGWMGARADALPGAPRAVHDAVAAVMRLGVDWFGYPPFVLQAAATGDAPLILTIYKNPLGVPQSVFDALDAPRDEARIAAAFALDGALLFDPEELDAMCQPAMQLAAHAIDAGELDRARRYLSLSKTEWYPAHHLSRDWVTGLGTWIYEQHGTEHVWASVEEAYNRPSMGALIVSLEGTTLREQIGMLGTLFHQHGMKYSIEVSDGRIDFQTAPCGSGGRLIEEGAYSAPKNFAMVEGKRLESFGLDAMPVYCMHCPATNRLVLEKALSDGWPLFLLVEPDIVDGRLRGHCSFNIFTKLEAVPAGMWERVGLTPPVVDDALAGR